MAIALCFVFIQIWEILQSNSIIISEDCEKVKHLSWRPDAKMNGLLEHRFLIMGPGTPGGVWDGFGEGGHSTPKGP